MSQGFLERLFDIIDICVTLISFYHEMCQEFLESLGRPFSMFQNHVTPNPPLHNMSQEDLERVNEFPGRLLNIMENRVTPNPVHRTVSQEFLERLLSTTENRVRSKPGSKCMICLEDFNTLNTSTGVVEWEIRLPCGHGVGSSCIVAWLRINNSCPACRATFPPQQPRPYLENSSIVAGRASIAIVPASERLVAPTARTAHLPSTTYRAVLQTLMSLVLKAALAFARIFALIFLALALIVGANMFNERYLPGFNALTRRILELVGWNNFLSSFLSGGPPSERAAVQARRCMDWQDCSFLSSRSR